MPDITRWIAHAGLTATFILIGSMVFAESGLLVGLFLPGDTLLLAAGLLAAQGHLPLIPTIIVIFAGAVIGDNMGYFFGRKTGPRLWRKQNGLFFRREYAERTQVFFQKHGRKTVLLARFIPYLRTFAPIVAGVGAMRRPTFILYNVLGALLWTVSMVMIGYWFGGKLPNVWPYMVPLTIAGIILFFLPTTWHLWRNRRSKPTY